MFMKQQTLSIQRKPLYLTLSLIVGFLLGMSSLGKTQQTVGLFQYNSAAQDGYTLFAPLQSTNTYLIDNCGLLINSWTSDLRPGSSVYLLEDGSLLRAERLDGTMFNAGGKGGRLTQLDWDGNPLWSFDIADTTQQQHHDIEVLPNGNILAIVWDLKNQEEVLAAGRDPQTFGTSLWVDKVVELEPIGTDQATIVWEWQLWDHLIQDFDSTKANYGIVAEHPELMDFNYVGPVNAGPGGNTDWSHFNSIDYNPELDQILLSSRHFSEFWIIDHSTNTEEAAGSTGGNSGRGGDILYRWGNPEVYDRGTDLSQQLFFQHDAQWIPAGFPNEGKITVYNNGLNRPGGSRSSLDIIEPPLEPGGTYTIGPEQAFEPGFSFLSYSGGADNFFYSVNISGVQPLSNGNLLACVGNGGRFFEITPEEELVWEYINPVNNFGPIIQGNSTGSNSVFRITRYSPDYSAFVDRMLMPGEPVELEPLPSDCVTSTENIFVSTIQLYPNPVRDILIVELDEWRKVNWAILNALGQPVQQGQGQGYQLELELSQVSKGLYFLQIDKKEAIRFLKI